MITLRSFLLAFALPALLAQNAPDPKLWQFTHPNASALMGMRLGGPMLDRMVDEMSAKAAASNAPQDALLMINLIKNVESIMISTPAVTPGTKNPPYLITVHGEFDLEWIKQKFQENAEKKPGEVAFTPYKNHELIETTPAAQATPGTPAKQSQPFSVLLLNEKTLVFGDPDSLRKAIDHLADDPKVKAKLPLFVKAAGFAGNYDFWAVATVPARAASTAKDPLSKTIRSMDLGIRMRNGMDLKVNLYATSAASAAEIGKLLTGMTQSMGQSQKTPSEATALLQRLSVTQRGSALTFQLTATEAEMKALGARMKTQSVTSKLPKASIFGIPIGSDQPAAPEAPKDPPLEQQKIRIYGLDEGVKEIPVKKP